MGDQKLPGLGVGGVTENALGVPLDDSVVEPPLGRDTGLGRHRQGQWISAWDQVRAAFLWGPPRTGEIHGSEVQ